MTGIDPALVPTFEHGMAGDQMTNLEDLDFVGQGLDLDHAPPCGVRHAVDVAADVDHALARDAAFEPEDRAERHQGQRPEMGPLFGEGLINDPAGRGMHRGLATVSSQWRSWAFRSSRFRNERARKKSSRI